MNDASEELNAYPAFWAPFILVGEGQDSESAAKEVNEQVAQQRLFEKEKEEDAVLAPKCEPLKNEALSLLNRTETTNFDQSNAQLAKLSPQMSAACPEKIIAFAGKIDKLIGCYNNAYYVELEPTGDNGFGFEKSKGEKVGFIIDENTNSFTAGWPRGEGDFIIGLTSKKYYCLKSTYGIETLKGFAVKAMVRK
jgi:hypothetical protein